MNPAELAFLQDTNTDEILSDEERGMLKCLEGDQDYVWNLFWRFYLAGWTRRELEEK